MNTVRIVQLNSKYTHASLAAWCLLAGIREQGDNNLSSEVIEGTVNEADDILIDRITAANPDIIGFCTYIWNVKTVMRLAERIKDERPQTTIILGGPEVSYNAGDVLESSPFVDYVISGEGELPFAQLCKAIEDESVTDNIPGVCRRGALSEPYISCDEPPSPYCDEYFASLGSRMAYIETSRGCPFSCAFCLSGRCGGVRYFDLDRVRKEILMLARSGTSTVKFVDRTFNANKSRAKEILRFIEAEHRKGSFADVCFHFEIAGDILDDEMIELFRAAPKGLFQLEIGMQSFNEKTLEYIHRRTDTQRLMENIRLLTEKKNIHLHIDLIAGLPYEDIHSFAESFNTAFALGADMLQLGFLKLLHGADMREDAERYPCAYSNEPPYEVLSTPYLNADELNLLRYTEDVLDRLHNSGRFRRTVRYLLEYASPFELFSSFGMYMSGCDTDRMSLDDFTEHIYRFFRGWKNTDIAKLRENLLCDRLSTNSSGRVPDFLRVGTTETVINIKRMLEASESTKRPDGHKRCVAILSQTDGEVRAVYADYNRNEKKHTALSAMEYELRYITMQT